MSRSSGRKTYTDSKGSRRHTTKWQQLVSKHGIMGAKKKYAGYRQRPASPTTTGGVSTTSTGTRRTRDNKIGSGGRSVLYYKGDRVGTWAKSRGTSNKGGDRGRGWYMERGYGSPRKPVPDTPLSRRLGIDGKTDLLTGHPSALYEDWEVKAGKKGKVASEAEEYRVVKRPHHIARIRESSIEIDTSQFGPNSIHAQMNKKGKMWDDESSSWVDISDYEAEDFEAELTMWQKIVKEHGIPPSPRAKHPAVTAYQGYRQKKPNPRTTGNVRNVKGGTRRVKDTNVGGHGRSVLYYKGDRVGTWTPSGGVSRKGANQGLGWFMERGYGTPRKPVPDTPLTRRLGIANKGRQLRGPGGLFGKMTSMLAPGAVAGLNQEEDWETQYHQRKMVGREIAEAESVSGRIDRWEDEHPGYRIEKPNPRTTGYLTMTKSGPRRVKDTNIGGHGRYAITHGGDRVGTWTPSGGSSRRGANTGLGWFMERGYGTPRKPVPDTPLTRRLGIANKGRQLRDVLGRFGPMTSILAPGAIAGLNTSQDWEQQYYQSRMVGEPVVAERGPGGARAVGEGVAPVEAEDETLY